MQAAIKPTRFKSDVLKVSRASPTVCLVELSTKPIPDFTFSPGQFVMVHTEAEGKKINKSYSIASGNHHKDKIELCIKEVPTGHVSRRLCTLTKMDQLDISGPYGLFTLRNPIERDVIFAATGTGISSVKSMIEYLFETGTDKQIWLFFGIRNESELLYRETFEWLASKNANFHFIPVLSQPSSEWDGLKGYVQEHIKSKITVPQNYDIYICGVVKSVDDIKQTAEQIGIPKQQIHFEKYT